MAWSGLIRFRSMDPGIQATEKYVYDRTVGRILSSTACLCGAGFTGPREGDMIS